MSFRQNMIQTARRGAQRLGERAALIPLFLLRQQNPDGGFRSRTGPSDLSETALGMQGLAALGPGGGGARELPRDPEPTLSHALARVESYLRSAGAGQGLDFSHLVALARAWAVLGELRPETALGAPEKQALLKQLETYRAKEGGYHAEAGSQFGSAQACFWAVGPLQVLNAAIPDSEGLIRCLNRLQVEPGVFTNFLAPEAICDVRSRIGSTIATAAAVAVLQHLGQPVNPATGLWLLENCRAEGGFLAVPNAPLPDLLSTASALQTLVRLGPSLDGVRSECHAYVESLWSEQGGFHGHSYDPKVDAETTFAGLLALGCL